jgi:hypothetical protein
MKSFRHAGFSGTQGWTLTGFVAVLRSLDRSLNLPAAHVLSFA